MRDSKNQGREINAKAEAGRLFGFSAESLIIIALLAALLAFTQLAVAETEISVSLNNTLEKHAAEKIFILLTSNETSNGSIDISSSQNIIVAGEKTAFGSINFSISSNSSNATHVNYTYALNISVPINATGTGSYSLNVNISLNFTNGTQWAASFNKTGTVDDTRGPAVQASTVNTETFFSNITISAQTNENATCRLGITDAGYDSLPDTFAHTGGLQHNQSLIKLSGSYTYYIRCKDYSGNKMNSAHALSFVVQDSAPKAKIILSDPSPVKAGLVEVTIIATENLAEAPLLHYKFSDESTSYTVPLSGSGNTWTGYFHISSSWNNKIGTFSFTGRDLGGNNGSEITEGKIFIVDTEKPAAPLSIGIAFTNGSIKVSWYYEGEQPAYFNLYRSSTPEPDYVDLYSTATGGSFHDTSFSYGKEYYYKVSAVDSAGNNGALSAQVFIIPQNSGNANGTGQAQSQTETQEQQPQEEETAAEAKEEEQADNGKSAEAISRKERLLRTKLNELDSLSVDVTYAVANLERPDHENHDLISDFNLVLRAQNAKQDIQELQETIAQLRTAEQDEAELNRQLNLISLKIAGIKQSTPKNVYVIDNSEFVQIIDAKDSEKTLEQTLRAQQFNLTDSERATFAREIVKLQKDVSVAAKLKVAMVEYLDRSRKNKSIITKEISYQSPDALEQVSILEHVPKEVASSSGVLDVKTVNYDIIQDDPVLKWDISRLTYDKKQFVYSIDKSVTHQELKLGMTIVLPSFDSLRSKPALSGFSIALLSNGNSNSLFLLIGLGTVALLSGYYAVIKVRKRTTDSVKGTNDGHATENDSDPDNLSYILIRSKIEESQEQIRLKNKAKLKEIYNEIMILYQELPRELKRKVHADCDRIRSSIMDIEKRG